MGNLRWKALSCPLETHRENETKKKKNMRETFTVSMSEHHGPEVS